MDANLNRLQQREYNNVVSHLVNMIKQENPPVKTEREEASPRKKPIKG